MWKNYKGLADEERVVETRGELAIQGPTINLNTRALDDLEDLEAEPTDAEGHHQQTRISTTTTLYVMGRLEQCGG